MAAAAKLANLRDERKKQMALYKSMPDQKNEAAKEIAGRIHAIDKNIAKIEAGASEPKGTPTWVWLIGVLVAGALAWGVAYFGGLGKFG